MNEIISSKDVLVNIFGNIIFIAITYFLQRLKKVFITRDPLWRPVLLIALFGIWFALNIALYGSILVFAVSSLVLGYAILYDLKQFWWIGFQSAGKEVKSGLDYVSALGLCTNALDFLGIGASKLTANRKEFEEAIKRCHHDERPIRFLLCDPGNEKLIRAARQAGVLEEEYRQKVIESLRVISELKVMRARNIEVRFYTDESLPVFRLMFINDSLCLASHYKLGEGDGSHLPQLHIRRARSPVPEARSFYYPFRTYFDRLWDRSERWDFQSRLEFA